MAKNFCTQCGAFIAEGQTFCSQCGNRLAEAGAAQAPSISPIAAPVHSLEAEAQPHRLTVSWRLVGGVSAACVVCIGAFLVFNRLASNQPVASSASGIHAIDFMNRTYETDCGKNVDPVFSTAVTVSKGRWVTTRGGEEVGFQVVKVAYGDLDGAGQEDAVVEISCYRQANNWDHRQVYVFAASPQGAQLRASTDADSFSEVGIENGRVAITSPDGGSRACPDWNVTNGFRVVGNRLVLDGVIRRTRPDCYQPTQGQRPTTVPTDGGATPAPPAANGATPARPLLRGDENHPTEVVVPGNQPWTASGVPIQVGETVTISATGGVSFSAGSKPSAPAGDLPDCLTVANGPYGWRASPFVANALPCSSLLGRIGETGAIFYVGAGTTFKAGASGQLYFGVNDNSFGDNSGHWTVEVSVSGSLPPASAGILHP
jgi:hypothetical protein